MKLIREILFILIPIYVFFLKMWIRVFPWRYDSRNPFRRYCKVCGQCQEQYMMDFESVPFSRKPTWWENMGMVYDDCFLDHKGEVR